MTVRIHAISSCASAESTDTATYDGAADDTDSTTNGRANWYRETKREQGRNDTACCANHNTSCTTSSPTANGANWNTNGCASSCTLDLWILEHARYISLLLFLLPSVLLKLGQQLSTLFRLQVRALLSLREGRHQVGLDVKNSSARRMIDLPCKENPQLLLLSFAQNHKRIVRRDVPVLMEILRSFTSAMYGVCGGSGRDLSVEELLKLILLDRGKRQARSLVHHPSQGGYLAGQKLVCS